MADEAIEWVPVRNVVEAYFETYRALGDKPLRDALGMGVVALRASIAELSGGERRSKPEVIRDFIVPSTLWKRRGSRNLVSNENRLTASIDYDHRGTNPETFKLLGLCVDKAQAEAALGITLRRLDASEPPSEQSRPALPTKDVGGAPRNAERWGAVITAIARLASEGYLDPKMDFRFKSRAEMRRAILADEAVANLGVSEDTIKPTVRQVFNALLGDR